MINKKTSKWLVASCFVFILMCAVLLTSCDKDNSSTAPLDTSDYAMPSAPEDKVIGNSTVKIDASNTSDGYISIKYLGNNSNVKLQVKGDDETYTYSLEKLSDYMVIPFTNGSGKYTIGVYENVYANQYAQAYATSLNVSLEDDNKPFLIPNYYVRYTKDDEIVKLTMKKTSSSKTQLDAVEDVYNYVIKNINYDYEKAATITDSYVPDLGQVISQKKGLCLDFASLMTAMLRIRNIPTKLVVGYRSDEYHAWISTYISDVGWVDNVIQFDGNDWTLMDPTIAASGGNDSKSDYEKNKDQYHALYFY